MTSEDHESMKEMQRIRSLPYSNANPSEVTDAYWIYAKNPNPRLKVDPVQLRKYIDSDGVYPRNIYEDKMKKPMSALDEKTKELDVEAVKKKALVGKWLIFKDRRHIDELWGKIANAVKQGKLGVTAKVSTLRQERKEHVICVYTYNFLDRDDVRRVREILKELGIVQKLYYKPDYYTITGIYFGEKKMPASRYFG